MRLAVAGGTGVVGTYVVQAAMAAGHDVVTLSRRTGVDARTGDGLAAAVRDVEVIVDTTNAGTINGDRATAFFTEVTHNLHSAGAGEGVSHLVVLSIVGLERVPGYGYYEAKLAHERAALAGPIPTTIIRATQFHEFPAQVLSWTRRGRFAVVPRMRIKPVAARSVGQVLLETAVAGPPARRARIELAGPKDEEFGLLGPCGHPSSG